MKRTARGRYETSFADLAEWTERPNGTRMVTIYFTDKDDGPSLTLYWMPPNYDGIVHYHETHSASIVVSGAYSIGKKWYRVGDCRMQEKGSVYGPEKTGEEGCLVANFFADRRGQFPWLLGESEPTGDWRSIVADVVLKQDWKKADPAADEAYVNSDGQSTQK